MGSSPSDPPTLGYDEMHRQIDEGDGQYPLRYLTAHSEEHDDCTRNRPFDPETVHMTCPTALSPDLGRLFVALQLL